MWFVLKRLFLGISLIAAAAAVLLFSDVHLRGPAAGGGAAGLGNKRTVHLIEYVLVRDVEEVQKGILAGLQQSGLVRGRDYEIKIGNAQGDMPTLSTLVDAAVSSRADLIIAVSTPTVQAAARRAGSIPVVFTFCASARAAGVAQSPAAHLPNVTGVETGSAYRELVSVVRECLPAARRIGTIFSPSEANTVFHREQLARIAATQGMELVAMPAETSAEVSDAALALCNRSIDAICEVPGNVTASSFPSIARAAQSARIPLFAALSSHAEQGAAVSVARDYYYAGVDAGLMAARILRGQSPASIPIEEFSKTKIIVNLRGASACGLAVPRSLLSRADQVIQN